MLFHVDASSSVPIYVQIVDQVKSATASGLLKAGEQLPSVRELAISLTVNPNTIARAYQELERDGIIYTSRGRGTFVADTSQKLTLEARLMTIEQHISRLLVEAYHLDISREQLLDLITRKLAEGEGEKD